MSARTKRLVTATLGAVLLWAMPISAQPRRNIVVVHPIVHARAFAPLYYDPFWGPWYPYAFAYPYPYAVRGDSSVRTEVSPTDAEVYVDGYYAGPADDFDGAFKHLHVTPGGHAIALYRDGFKTVTENVYVRPDSTFKLNVTMNPLAPGEKNEAVPLPGRPLTRGTR